MTPRRTFVLFSLALASTTSCLAFRPINPNPPLKQRAEKPPAEMDAAPAAAQPTQVAPAPAPTQTPTPQTPTPQTPVASAPVAPVTAPAIPFPQAAAPAPAPQRTEATVAPVRPGRVSDANVAAMVLASNNTDISYARLAPSRAQREDVLKFAERMLTDHTVVNGLVTDLLRKLDLAPVDNTISLDMRDESANKRDILRELSGFAFDSTYMENEVAYHQRFLASIDNVMMPSARNAELRNLLAAVRPAVSAHLAHAEQTRANVLAKK